MKYKVSGKRSETGEPFEYAVDAPSDGAALAQAVKDGAIPKSVVITRERNFILASMTKRPFLAIVLLLTVMLPFAIAGYAAWMLINFRNATDIVHSGNMHYFPSGASMSTGGFFIITIITSVVIVGGVYAFCAGCLVIMHFLFPVK